jgi:hypothetical protein
MTTSRVIDFIRDNKVPLPVSPAAVARDMNDAGILITRAAVHSACKREGIPTQRKASMGERPCLFCNKPVRIRSKLTPYNRHAKCWTIQRAKNKKKNQITVTCAACGKKQKRYPSDARGQMHFCNRKCRDKGQRTGKWPNYPKGFDPKTLRAAIVT